MMSKRERPPRLVATRFTAIEGGRPNGKRSNARPNQPAAFRGSILNGRTYPLTCPAVRLLIGIAH